MKFDLVAPMFLAVMLTAGSAAPQTAPPYQATTGSEAPAPSGVFHGEVEVSVVTLYATVVDRKGMAVSGLKAEDFVVFEGGEVREITLFEAIDRIGLELQGAVGETEDEERPAPEVQPRGESVAVVFDNIRLERRARRRVLKALNTMIEPLWAQGAEVMVGVMAPRFEVVQTFDRDPEHIASAFEQVADTPTTGDALKSERRALKRDVYRGLTTASQETAAVMAMSEGQRLELRINAFRELEMQRALEGLNRIESLVRSLAGRGGRTSLIWVTEDMTFRPAIDIYRRFFNRFSTYLTLDRPDLWGTERDLRQDFDRVIGAAHAAGVTVHVVDASDRDSEVMDTDFGMQDMFTTTASLAAGASIKGYDLSEANDAIEGSQYLGYGTGGDFFGNSRNFELFVDSFVETTSTYYVIGYDRPAPGDGQTHSVRLEVNRPELRVRHPAKILDRTREQRLTDSVVSHLVWGDGNNPLGLLVEVDEKQETEDDTVLWPVDLKIPAVGLLPGDDGRALVTVVVCVGQSDGTMAKPYEFRLVLPVPKDNPQVIGTAHVTLSTRPESDRVAVGILDELSGATSTEFVDLTPDR